MRLRKYLHIGKQTVCHPLIEYRRLYFRCCHANRKPHDVLCRQKGFVLKLRSNSVLAEPLFAGTGFEESEMALLRRLAKPGMQVIDVGANIGLYSVLLGKLVGPTGHVWGFEPFPPIVNYLKQNIELNRLNNVTVVEKAVAEMEGSLEFQVFPEGCDVYNSLGAAERPVESLRAIQKTVVPVITLDAYMDRSAVREVDIIKIDVEGAEERAIQGAEQLIRRNPNIHIVVEMYEPSAQQCGCSSKRLVELLATWGFSMFEITRYGDAVRCNTDRVSGMNALFRRE